MLGEESDDSERLSVKRSGLQWGKSSSATTFFFTILMLWLSETEKEMENIHD